MMPPATPPTLLECRRCSNTPRRLCSTMSIAIGAAASANSRASWRRAKCLSASSSGAIALWMPIVKALQTKTRDLASTTPLPGTLRSMHALSRCSHEAKALPSQPEQERCHVRLGHSLFACTLNQRLALQQRQCVVQAFARCIWAPSLHPRCCPRHSPSAELGPSPASSTHNEWG